MSFWEEFEFDASPMSKNNLSQCMETIKSLKEILPFSGWFIAGGFGVALIEQHLEYPSPHNDVDIFFENEEVFQRSLEIYSKRYATKYTSQFAVTFDNGVQFVNFAFGTPEETLERFDINVCRVAYEPFSEAFTDLRGDKPKEIQIMNPSNYTLLQRVKKYLFRDYTISLQELQKLRVLMTSDGLSELNMYGDSVGKMHTTQFIDAVYQFLQRLNPKHFYELFDDVDFMDIVQEQKMRTQNMSVFGMIGYLNLKGLPNVSNEEQAWAIKWNNNCLVGDEYRKAVGKYPDYFV